MEGPQKSRKILIITWGITGFIALGLLVVTVILALRTFSPSFAGNDAVPVTASDTSGVLQNTPTVTLGVRATVAPPAAEDEPAAGDENARQAAVISDRDGQVDLYLAETTETGIRYTRLTESPEWEDRPAWSPDGQWLAFARGPAPAGGATFTQERFALSMVETLHIMRADGSDERVLTNLDGWVFGLAWSPRGTHIAVQTIQDTNENRNPETAPADHNALWQVDVASGEVSELVQDTVPWSTFAWTGDGAQLICTTMTSGSQSVYAIDVESGSSALMASTAGMPAIAPDGQRFAYVSYDSGAERGSTAHFHAVSADGSDHVQLTGDEINAGFSQEFSWSPDGKYLLYTQMERDRANNLYTFELEGQEIKNLTYSLDKYALWPRWSPDGELVLFSALEYDIENGNSVPKFPIQLYVVDIGTGEIIQITSDHGNYLKAAWRPGT